MFAAAYREIGVDLMVEQGDTIESLSQKYGFSVAKLREANGGMLRSYSAAKAGMEQSWVDCSACVVDRQ